MSQKDVLDHGFVRLVDHMPRQDLDTSIVQAARVSYGDGTKTARGDRGLLRYLLPITTSPLLSHGWGRTVSLLSQLSTPRLCVFGSYDTIHFSWTVPMSHYKYNEWWDKHKIGIHCHQGSPQADFWVTGGGKAGLVLPTFSTKIVCVGLLTAISQQLNCSNVSLQV